MKQLVKHNHCSHQNELTSLREIELNQKPQQKLLTEGAQSLDNSSLISILLGKSRGSEEDELSLARRVLITVGSLESLAKATVDQLCLIRGIGPAKASRLLAAFELAKRVLGTPIAVDLTSSAKVQLPHPSEQMIDIIRTTWEGITPLLTAITLPSTLTDSAYHLSELEHQLSLQRSIDSAITLSLSSAITDTALHGRWLSMLLLRDETQPWVIISLNDQVYSHSICIDAIERLTQLATEMGVQIESIALGSSDPDRIYIHYPRSKCDFMGDGQ